MEISMTDTLASPFDPEIADFAHRFGTAMNEEGVDVSEWRRRYSSFMAEQGSPDVAVPTRDITVPTRHGDMKARLYLPSNARSALLIYAHGGGFVVGDLDSLDMPLHALSHGANIAILSLDYALAPENMYPVGLEQCQDALVWADKHRQELGDVRSLGIAGDSAGGNFTALLTQWAAQTGGPKIAWQALINPVLDFVAVQESSTESHRLYGTSPMLSTEAMQIFLQSYFRDRAAMVEASPLLSSQGYPELPPTFIAAAECDALRDDSLAYARKLTESGVPVELKVYAGMSHNFMTLTRISRTAREFLDDFIAAASEWAARTEVEGS